MINIDRGRFTVRNIIGFILLLALSAVFLFSAWSKYQSIDPFSWTFLEMLPVNTTGAAIIARIFIGIELMIGLLLLAHVYLRAFTYKATIALLLILTGYLVVLVMKQGNTGNCGCFGEWIYMRPVSAIWKNVLMIGVTLLLYFIYPGRTYNNSAIAAVSIGMVALALPFVINPRFVEGNGEVVHEPINLSPVRLGSPAPNVDLQRGKHVVAFLSLTCPHCKKAAYLMHIMHLRDASLPFYMVVNGSPHFQKDFWTETKATDVPHTYLQNTDSFKSMAGEYVPSIYWVNNGVIERKVYFTELDPIAIKKWLQQ